MNSTLSERVKERMAAVGIKNAELAQLCGVKPPTSFNWGSGKTKSIKGEPLLLAARALGVTPDWLATGAGVKIADSLYETSPRGQSVAKQTLRDDYAPIGTTNINSNKRGPVDVLNDLKALLAGVEQSRLSAVAPMLESWARNTADDGLRDAIAMLLAPQAFAQEMRRSG